MKLAVIEDLKEWTKKTSNVETLTLLEQASHAVSSYIMFANFTRFQCFFVLTNLYFRFIRTDSSVRLKNVTETISDLFYRLRQFLGKMQMPNFGLKKQNYDS